MNTIERLSRVQDILSKSKRVVFPLITPSGTLAGLILTRNVMYCLSPDAPTWATYAEAEAQQARDHGEALREAQNKNKLDWHNDRKDYSATITKKADLEDVWINFLPYMDAGCMTARPQTPAKRLAALFRRVGLSHLCITDKDNVFRGLVTRRSLITPPGAALAQQQHGHGGHNSSHPGSDAAAAGHPHDPASAANFDDPISPTGGGAYLRAPTSSTPMGASSRKNSQVPSVDPIQEEDDGQERKQHYRPLQQQQQQQR
jgi:hypothetical protein